MFDLRKYAEENRLRMAFSCKELICPTRSRRFEHDHFYDGFKDFIGLHIERPTKKTLNNLVRKLLEMGAIKHQTGDLEANLKIPIDKIPQIAKFMKIAKGKPPKNGFGRMENGI